VWSKILPGTKRTRRKGRGGNGISSKKKTWVLGDNKSKGAGMDWGGKTTSGREKGAWGMAQNQDKVWPGFKRFQTTQLHTATNDLGLVHIRGEKTKGVLLSLGNKLSYKRGKRGNVFQRRTPGKGIIRYKDQRVFGKK